MYDWLTVNILFKWIKGIDQIVWMLKRMRNVVAIRYHGALDHHCTKTFNFLI